MPDDPILRQVARRGKNGLTKTQFNTQMGALPKGTDGNKVPKQLRNSKWYGGGRPNNPSMGGSSSSIPSGDPYGN